ncbi:MAG TPA: hypothetical protein PLD27_00805 [bacterium]|nr:hypothetical protein [bacterium]HOL46907.1 hypothetical protein [bacterium]HPQ18331.1 hypothetical protein [bacterium]
MKKKFFILIMCVMIFIMNCAGVKQVKEDEKSDIYQANIFLQNIFNNYENKNYMELKKLFGGALVEKYNMIENSIREEFNRYDFLKISYNIEKIDKTDNLLDIHFNWRKNRKVKESGSFSTTDSSKNLGKTIFSFDKNSGLLVQIKGDFLFGIAGNF